MSLPVPAQSTPAPRSYSHQHVPSLRWGQLPGAPPSWTTCTMEPDLPPRFGTSPAPPTSHGMCRAAPSSSSPHCQSTALAASPQQGQRSALTQGQGPTAEHGPSHSSRGGAGWGQQGRALGPGLRRGLISDKGYGYLSIVNGYSIKLTGGQRFPLDFESSQGRETKLQTPTFTLLKRKTKHKRERCDLAARDG